MLNLHASTYTIFTPERYVRYLALIEDTVAGLPDDRAYFVRELYPLLAPCDREDDRARHAMISRLRRDDIIRRTRVDRRIAYMLNKSAISHAAAHLRRELAHHGIAATPERRALAAVS